MIVRSSKTILPTLVRLSSVAAACLWALPANAENLVTNGTFDDGTYAPWWGYAATGAAQTLAVDDKGRLCSTMDADAGAGKNLWDVIVGLSGLELKKGQYYHLTFSASADADRSIHFKTGLGDAPYTDYFLKSVTFPSTAKVFDYTFLNLKDDSNAQFQFQIGGSPGTVCIDNVVIEPVDPPKTPDYTTASKTGHALKDYADVVKIGSAVDTPTFLSSPIHNSILVGEFNMMTPSNSMKMNLIQPSKGVFDWTDTDALIDFADKNHLEFHGHPLVWHTQTPSWLTDGKFDRDAMIQVMYDHIDALVGHYAGRIPYWDVVNETIDLDKGDKDTGLRHTPWFDAIGKDYIELAFQRAHQADPDAKLLFADYNIEVQGNTKADRAYELIKDMVDRGIPVHQVGFQSHYFVTADGGSSGIPDMSKIRANMDRYAKIGVDVQITECDFRIGAPLDDDKLKKQADFFRDLLKACVDAPNCSHFTVWGLSDFDSWVPSTFPGFDYAHVFDADFKPKPAYFAMTEVLAAGGAGGSGGAAGGAGSQGSAGHSSAAAGSNAAGSNAAGSNAAGNNAAGSDTAGSDTAGSKAAGGSSKGASSSQSSSGCTLHPSAPGAEATKNLGLFALLGLALGLRRRSPSRCRS